MPPGSLTWRFWELSRLENRYEPSRAPGATSVSKLVLVGAGSKFGATGSSPTPYWNAEKTHPKPPHTRQARLPRRRIAHEHRENGCPLNKGLPNGEGADAVALGSPSWSLLCLNLTISQTRPGHGTGSTDCPETARGGARGVWLFLGCPSQSQVLVVSRGHGVPDI